MQNIKKRNQWSSEQKTLLLNLYSQFHSKKWKKISLAFERMGFQREKLQIRDKWINLYDPSVNKSQWKQQQLKLLYDFISFHGTRWSRMKILIGRTQNMARNKFYGTMRNYVRFVLKNSKLKMIQRTPKIKKISSKTLSDIYASQNGTFLTIKGFQFLQDEPRQAIISMNYLINQAILLDRITLKNELYEKLAIMLVESIRQKLAFQVNDQQKMQQNGAYSLSFVKDQGNQDDVSCVELQSQSSIIGHKDIKIEELGNKVEIIVKKQEENPELIKPSEYYPFFNAREFHVGHILFNYSLLLANSMDYKYD